MMRARYPAGRASPDRTLRAQTPMGDAPESAVAIASRARHERPRGGRRGGRGLVTANADEAERQRRLPTATVEALVEADLMRMALPAAYGGPEADPLTMLTAIETLARADGAAGWCSMIASTTASQALFLAPGGGARDLPRRVDRRRRRVRPERRRRRSPATPSR